MRQYSPDEERRQTGWIGGKKCEVILDRTHGRHAHERRDPTLLQLPMDWSATMTSTGRTHATALRVTTLGAVLLAINCGGNSAPPSD